MFSSASVGTGLSIRINKVTRNICYAKCHCNDAFWSENLGAFCLRNKPVTSSRSRGHFFPGGPGQQWVVVLTSFEAIEVGSQSPPPVLIYMKEQKAFIENW